MACLSYKKLQQECDTYRKQLGEFHFMKIPNWQQDDKILWLVRGKQKAILDAQELMDWHSTHCEECKRAAPSLMEIPCYKIAISPPHTVEGS
jgi:hypothetical protein